jgi:hypothetical protein
VPFIGLTDAFRGLGIAISTNLVDTAYLENSNLSEIAFSKVCSN